MAKSPFKVVTFPKRLVKVEGRWMNPLIWTMSLQKGIPCLHSELLASNEMVHGRDVETESPRVFCRMTLTRSSDSAVYSLLEIVGLEGLGLENPATWMKNHHDMFQQVYEVLYRSLFPSLLVKAHGLPYVVGRFPVLLDMYIYLYISIHLYIYIF